MTSNETTRPSPAVETDRVVLTSWKEIATQLGVSVKTAQRYETELGLPVKRLNGRVSIPLSELLAWQDAQTIAPKSESAPWWADTRRLRIALAVSGTLLVLGTIGAIAFFVNGRSGPPAAATADGFSLTATDAENKFVWRHVFSLPLYADWGVQIPTYFGDLDNDGKTEALAVWQHVRRDAEGWMLHCLDERGSIRWTLEMKDIVRNASGKEFKPPYVIREYQVFDSPEKDGTTWVAAVFVHVADVVSTVVVVDSAGKRRGQYWHVGHLNAVRMFDADGDGKEDIVAGGVRHGAEQAVLVAFHTDDVTGANSMPENHPRALVGQSASSEIATAFVARSELSRELAVFNYISTMEVANGFLHAHVYESLYAPEGYLMYEFAPGLRLHDITLSAAYGEAQKVLRRRSRLGEQFSEKELARLKAEYRVERVR